MNKIIAEFPKNSMEKFVASLGDYKSEPRIDIRVHWQPEASDPENWVPTKKGHGVSARNQPPFSCSSTTRYFARKSSMEIPMASAMRS